MPSKKSKTTKRTPSRSSAGRICSEAELAEFGRGLGRELRPGARVLLEGEMGAGKSTLARAILEGLGVERAPEGSPTFAVAHEYRGLGARIVHTDFYRLRSEAEIEQAGLEEIFWDPRAIVIAEWVSLFADFAQSVEASEFPGKRIRLEFVDGAPASRRVSVESWGD